MKNQATVKGYKIDYTANTVFVNHKFYAEAQRDFFSDEAEMLRKIKEAFSFMTKSLDTALNVALDEILKDWNKNSKV